MRDGRALDGRSQLALAMARWMRRPPLHLATLAGARHELEVSANVLVRESAPMALEEDHRVAGPSAPIRVRVYRPRGIAEPAPALVYLHGGGFALGSLDAYAASCRGIANDARCVVVAVEYRLAPEHPFPAAPDDALAAFRAIASDATAFGIDARRIAIGGDSAGGNLAAVVSLDTRADAVRPCFQLLLYPVVDQTRSFPSIESCGRGFFLEKETLEWFCRHYLPDPESARDPRASPLFASDVAGAPPALVMTAGFDPLRDEGDAYAAKLRDAGVPVEHRQYGSLIHGFLAMTGAVHGAREALRDATDALRRAVAARG